MDNRIVLTLDAGGTNFDFTALCDGKDVTSQIRMPSNAKDLDKCLQTINEGFYGLIAQLDRPPSAISFAFPGPADYEQGIIGDLNNLPAFRGGIPLKAILEREFKIPVYINNDANLFVYGEAIGGLLPAVNELLEAAGNPKRYKNLVGVTLGTGFGGGFVMDGHLLVGENSLGGEIWLTSTPLLDGMNAEEAMSIRAIQNAYVAQSGLSENDAPDPLEISLIARGDAPGDREAALFAYRKMGTCLGDVLANLVTFTDSLIVIGGGMAYANDLFFPAMLEQMRKPFQVRGKTLHRLVQEVFNLEDESEMKQFLFTEQRKVEWPGLPVQTYDPKPNLAVGVNRLGTRNATALGAYAIALANLDESKQA